MRRTARQTVLFAAFLAAASLSCGREITGPGAGRTSGPVSFAPQFPVALRAPGGGLSDLVAFEKVRVVFRRSDGTAALDKTFDFPSDADSLPVTLSVPLSAGATEAGEVLSLSMFYVDAANDTVFTGGPIAVSVRPSRPGDPAPQPIPVILRYTGPGEEAVRVVLSPASATVTAGQTRTFTTQAFDQFNTPVQAPVIFESTDLSVVTVSDAGVVTALDRRAGAFIIAKLYSDQADTSAVSVVLPASRMAASSGTGQSAPAGTALAQSVVVLVTASDGVPVAGVSVAFAASSGGAAGAATVITDAAGLAATTWMLGNTVGAQTLTATVAGLTGSPLSFTATATPGVPSALVFTTQPSTVSAGAVIAPAVVVEVRTSGGTVAAGYSDSVSIAIGTNPAAGTLGGVRTVAAVNGIATFAGLTLDRAGAGYTLVANSGALNATTSGAFAVNAAAAAALQFTVQPAGGTPGVALTPAPAVRAVDAFGNPTTLTGNVTIALGSNPGGTTLGGTLTQAAVANGATFPGLTLGASGIGYTLVASSGALTAATSAAFDIGTGVATALVFSTPPSDAVAGVAFAPALVVQARTVGNQLDAAFGGPVTIAIGTNPGAGTLTGTLTVAAVNGIATFPALTLDRAAAGYTLTASSGALAPATSSAFTVSAAAAAALEFTVQPAASVAGVALAPAPTVRAVDAFGNPALFTGSVTITLGANPGGATLGGTTSQAAIGNVATFSALTLDRAAAGYTLIASSGALTAATSGVFTVTAAAAAALQFTVQPAGGTPGVAITPPPAVRAVDAFGNPATFTGNVTLAIGANPGGTTLGGTTTRGAVANVSTFNDITLGATGTGYTLVAAATGLTGVTSDPFNIGASVMSWVNPSGGNWSVAANWNLNRIPNAADLVDISLGGTYTVTLDVNANVAGIQLGTGASGTQTLAMTGRTLTLAGNLQVGTRGAMSVTTSSVVGTGSVVNAGAITLNGGSIALALDNQGTLVASALSSLGGAVTTSAGSVLRIGAIDGSGTANLTVANGFTNNGAIELTVVVNIAYPSQLTVTTGTLVNAPGGTITALGGTAPGGTRTLAAELDNRGTFTTTVATTLTRAGSAHLNSGTIDLTGGNFTVNQSAPTPSFTNTGTITIGAGRTFTVSGGAFTSQAGATVSGATLALTGVTAAAFNGVTPAVTAFSLTNTTATFANPVTSASTAFTLANSTLNGAGPFTNPVGQTLTLNGSAINMPVDNQGLLISSALSSITGALTTSAGSVLRIGAIDGSGTANLTVANGFTNNGAIELTVVINIAYPSQLTVTAGTLVNAPGGTITALGGAAPGGTRTLAAQFDNQGTITAAVPLVITRAGSAHLNSGTIDLTGGNFTVNQSAPTPSFTNTGTITIGAGRTFTVSGGAFTSQAGATVSGATLALTGVTAAAFNGVTPAVTAFSLTNTTATFANPVTSASTAFTLANSTLNGAGPFTNPVGQTLTLNGSAINMPVDNQGLLISSALSSITGALTTSAGSVLRIGAIDGSGTANLTVANGFTNNGAIELTVVINIAYPSQLTVTAGTLVNAPGGTITALGGAAPGGTRTLAAQFDNQGTITAAVPLVITRAGSAHLNSGTIDLTGGNFTVNQSAPTPSFTNTGTITIGAGRTFTVSGGAFTSQAGATVSGATLALTGVTAAAFNGVTPAVTAFSLTNTTATFANPVTSASTAFTLANSTLNGAGPFTNPVGQTLTLNGSAINMPVDNQGLLISSALSSITGALTTSAGSVLRIGAIDGSGTANLTVANGFTNNGAIELTVVINIAYPSQLTVTAGTLVNAPGGTITALGGAAPGGTRTLAAQFDNQGTITAAVPLVVTRAGAAHLNSGTIDLTGGNFTVNQSAPAPSFTNTGTLTIGAGRTFSVSGGTFTSQAGGTVGGAGALAFTNTTVAFNGATPAVASFSAVNTDITFAQPVSSASTAFSFAQGSTVGGAGTFTNVAGQTVTLNNSAINLPFDNQGTLVASALSSLGGAVTTSTGSVLRVGAIDGSGTANLTVANGFTNNGAIELTVVINIAYASQLTVTTGTLVNAPGGTITTLNGAAAGGTRTIAAQLDNQGTLTVGPGTAGRLTVTGSLTNSGTINLELGGTTAATQFDQIVVGGTPSSATLGGTLNVSLINAFTPASGNQFLVLTTGTGVRSGTFATRNLPGGITDPPTYTGSGVTLVAP